MKTSLIIFCLVLISVFGFSQTNFQHYYGGSLNEQATAITQTYDRGYAIAGTTTSFGAGGTDYFIIRVDAIGNLVWQKTFGGTSNDASFNMTLAETSDSGFALTGTTYSFGSSGGDAYMLKLDNNGVVQWTQKYAGGSLDHGRGIDIMTNGEILFVGDEASYTFGTTVLC